MRHRLNALVFLVAFVFVACLLWAMILAPIIAVVNHL
jgi:hypothetical protein